MLTAAGIHAGWNLLAKRSGGAVVFVWLFSLAAVIFYAPAAIWILVVERPHIGPVELISLGGTALLHTFYYVILLRGYRIGDLSLVYPLARSTGPLLATIGAIILLDERPTAVALFGGCLILLGAVVLTWNDRRSSRTSTAVRYGLLIGLFIATYTVWDKFAVSELDLPPLLVDYGSNVGRVLLLLPLVMRQRSEVRQEWERSRWSVCAIGIMGPLSYILVLTAMSFTPLYSVAPAREISILFATILGTRLLGENHPVRRTAAAVAMVAGVIAIALGGEAR